MIDSFLEPAALTILQDYFVRFIDMGVNSDETPLYTRVYEGEVLDEVVARKFSISPAEAKLIIDAAGKYINI